MQQQSLTKGDVKMCTRCAFKLPTNISTAASAPGSTAETLPAVPCPAALAV